MARMAHSAAVYSSFISYHSQLGIALGLALARQILLDPIRMRAVSSSDRIFCSRHRTSVFSVHPTDLLFWGAFFVGSLAGEVGRAVLSRKFPAPSLLLMAP